MAKLKTFLFFLIVLIVVLLGLAFLYSNDGPVALDLLFVSPIQTTLGACVLLGFVLGAVLGLLVRFPGTLWHRSASRLQAKKISQQEREIERLKSDSAKAG